jgi:hypothetical protein
VCGANSLLGHLKTSRPAKLFGESWICFDEVKVTPELGTQGAGECPAVRTAIENKRRVVPQRPDQQGVAVKAGEGAHV